MVCEIVKDPLFLSIKSLPADKDDRETVGNLVDTLKAHKDGCVGMAANMIGVSKRIMAIYDNDEIIVLINPVIVDKSAKSYDANEGCLSLDGVRPVKRYNTIVVEYLDEKFKKKKKNFTGFTSQIIQHEYDHFEGILI